MRALPLHILRMDNLTDADSTALGLQVAIAIVLVLLTTCVWLVWKLQATQGQLQTTEGQLQATQGQLQTTEGQLQATQGQLQATEGQLQATQGQLQATQEVRDKVAGTWWRTMTDISTVDVAAADIDFFRRQNLSLKSAWCPDGYENAKAGEATNSASLQALGSSL